MEDYKKKKSTLKGQLTTAQNKIDLQLKVDPHKRDLHSIKRLISQVEKISDTFLDIFMQVEDGTHPMEQEQRHEEELIKEDFMRRVDEARRALRNMEDQCKSLHLYKILIQDIEEWEDMDADLLHGTFEDSKLKLQDDLEAFKLSVHTPGSELLPELKKFHKDLKIRLARLKLAVSSVKEATPTKETKDSKASGTKKLHKLPLPTFDGDVLKWRSFWRRFLDYMEKLGNIIDDEKISYLLEAIQDKHGQKIITSAITNGWNFDNVSERLQTTYDKPRKVFQQCVRRLQDLSPSSYTHDGIVEFQTDVGNLRSILLHYGDKSADQLLTALAEEKMGNKFHQEWMLHSEEKGGIPSWDLLDAFCIKRAVILDNSETVKPNKQAPATSSVTTSSRKFSRRPQVSMHNNEVDTCRLCHKGNHPLYCCQDFKTMDPFTRYQKVQSINYCYNCLGPGHLLRECPSKKGCKECGKKHNTLLHNPEKTSQSTPIEAQSQAAGTSLTVSVPNMTALIQTCQVIIEADGKSYTTRAMIDSGSTMSFLTDRVASILRLRKTPFVTTVTGLSQTPAAATKFKTSIHLKSVPYPDEPAIEVQPSLVKSITGSTPSTTIKVSKDMEFVKGLKLADPSFYMSGRIDLLLGQDVLAQLMRQGTLSSDQHRLYAQNTALGWVVGGYCNTPSQAVKAHICCRASIDQQTHDFLRAFWEVEEPPSSNSQLSQEDQMALDHFVSTHTRQEDGRYIVRLPLKLDSPALGSSRPQALKRYIQNKSSLTKKQKWDTFSKAISEYEDMNHAEPVPKEDLSKPPTLHYYLPLHGVTKESSTSTKLRIVFDGSCKTASGFSLNDRLIPGPTMYPLLTNILIKFRDHQIGMSSDVSKMFREVALHPLDRDMHRYLAPAEDGQVKDMRMCRVTFGVSSSPFLATQVLRQLAHDYAEEMPEAAHIISTCFYVDDCLTGADTLQDAMRIREALNHLLMKAQMNLRKWRSNCQELKDSIPEDLLEIEHVHLIASPHQFQKTLGLHWDTYSDTFHVATPILDEEDIPTKRIILSDIARTFDVLGWFSPVTVSLKILLQRLWELGLDWDQPLPTDLVSTWKTWRSQLCDITAYPIPRYYHIANKKRLLVQLHGFSDASNSAYAGVVYVRSTYEDTTTTTSLVIAKTKVAPLHKLTIPRLELCGALLVSKLLSSVMEALGIERHNVFAWSDSQIVLSWIHTPPHKLKVYEANRVSSIIEKVPSNLWHYVRSRDNPADLGSRGLTVKELIESDLWWNGPQWLRLSPFEWPIGVNVSDCSLTSITQSSPTKSGISTVFTCTSKESTLTSSTHKVEDDILMKFSSHEKLIHIVGWIKRFSNNCKLSKEKRLVSSYLSIFELYGAEKILTRKVQSSHFSQEITLIKQKLLVQKSSPLKSLHPFLDQDGILRVGGRLSNSAFQFSSKHPIILPKRSPLSRLLVLKLHYCHLHSGPTLLLGILSRTHHILGARCLIRQITRNCVICKKSAARVTPQLMGDLPASRVTPSPAFSSTGIDFAGPFMVKRGYTRKPQFIKVYMCLFICLGTRAIHLELVTDMTAEAFTAALTRFISRRGCPTEIWSDNGTNFVGTNRKLQEVYALLREDSNKNIMSFCSTHRITWHFSPPRAPHFGGIWEAAIKSAKIILKKLLGSHTFNLEEFQTILCEVEAALNSRPLCHLTSQPEDGIEPLTPGHFLIGRPLTALPTIPVLTSNISTLKRWNLCKYMTQEFWRRWKHEYIITLQQRNKWQHPQYQFKVGDVVLIKDQAMFLKSWPIAVITSCHPGKDGQVRVVTLRTSQGEYTRPANKLVLLVSNSNS